jgi:hypothetical protein
MIEPSKRSLGLVEPPDQKKSPNLEMPRVRRIHPVAVFFERCPRRIECLLRPTQVACHESDLSFGDETPRAGHGLSRTKCASCTLQKRLGAYEIPKLRHRDSAKCKRRRVISESNSLQDSEEVTGGESLRRSRDQRVHRNPVTLVTPTTWKAGTTYHSCLATKERAGS